MFTVLNKELIPFNFAVSAHTSGVFEYRSTVRDTSYYWISLYRRKDVSHSEAEPMGIQGEAAPKHSDRKRANHIEKDASRRAHVSKHQLLGNTPL